MPGPSADAAAAPAPRVAPDWQPPAGAVPALAHRPDPVPGWRCACGALTLAGSAAGVGTAPGHGVVVDLLSAADEGTDPDYLARFAVCDEDIWAALLARATFSPALVGWLVDQAAGTGPHRFAATAALQVELLGSAVPLRTADLARLAGSGAVATQDAVAALLAHPAATIRVTTSLLGALLDPVGHPAGARVPWDRVTYRVLAETLLRDPRPHVAYPTWIRRQGLRPWAVGDWDVWNLDERAVAAAQDRYAAAMAAIDGLGSGAWQVVARLVAQGTTTGPEYLDVAAGILSAPGRA